MTKFKGHLYKWDKPFDSIRHNWELRSVHGAINFHCSVYNGTVCAGLEFHSIYPKGDYAPDHVNCPLTGGRCWHDGTSLYASETLWPLIEPYLKAGDHGSIFTILETEADALKKYSPKYIET